MAVKTLADFTLGERDVFYMYNWNETDLEES